MYWKMQVVWKRHAGFYSGSELLSDILHAKLNVPQRWLGAKLRDVGSQT